MVALTPENLAEMTDRLVRALGPDRIYLFGSRAYGLPRPNSDVDLLIVMPDGANMRGETDRIAREAVGPVGAGVDILIYTAQDFDRRSGWRANLEYTVRNQGRLLHGVDGMAFAKDWLEKGVRDLQAAERIMAIRPPLSDIIAFHCQQAAEKVLKAYLVHQNEPFEKVHDLSALCDLCAKRDAAFTSVREVAGSLNQYAVKFRYPGEGDVTATEAAQAFDTARHVWRFALDRFPQDLAKDFRAFVD